jgi:hypothetical protein
MRHQRHDQWRLAASAYSDISHDDDRHSNPLGGKHAAAEQPVPKCDEQSI